MKLPKFRLGAEARENIAGYLFASPWIIGFLCFSIGPILATFYFSFTAYDIVDPATLTKTVGFLNYSKLYNDELFWKALWNTLYYMGFSVPLGMAGSFILAMLLNNKLKAMGIFRTVFYLPSVTTGVAVALLWMWIFDPGYGILNRVLDAVFHIRPLWLLDENWSKPAMILMSLWSVGGSRCLIFLAGLQGLSPQYYEAAEIDGANWFQKTIKITIPLMTPIIFFELIMSIIRSFGVFTNAYVMTSGGPLNSTLFYVYYLYIKAFENFKLGYASALAWIFFIIMLTFTLIQFKLSDRWVFYTHDTRKGR